MVNQELNDYIKQQLQQGISKEQIKNSLLNSGWQTQDIEEAFSLLSNNINQPPQAPQTQILPPLPNASIILKEAFQIYKQRFSTFLGISIIPTLILTLAVIPLLGGSSLSSRPSSSGIIFIIFLAILFLIIVFVSQIWGGVSLIYAVKDRDEKIGVIESYRRSWKNIFSYLKISLLTGFIILGGLLLLIVPGIIFTIWFIFSAFILITEDLKGMDALLKSREYVRGKWGAVFWRLLIIAIIYIVISLILNTILKILSIPAATEVNRFLTGLFLTPLTISYTFLIYNYLKANKGDFVFTPAKKKKVSFIIIGVIGFLLIPIILFSVVFLSLGSSRIKARNALRESNLRLIQFSLEIYFDKNQTYPSTLNELYPEFLNTVPKDPQTGLPYYYQKENSSYILCANIESKKDKHEKCVSPDF